MARYILRRLLQMIPLILGITFLTFAIINLVPGSPVANLQFSNPRLRPQDIQNIQHNLGLDKPWPERYVIWLKNLLHGDLGYSLINGTPVTSRIFNVLPNTLLLTATALVFALLISIPLGVYSAVRHNSFLDHFVTVGSTAAYSIPTFWLGLMLILLFGVQFHNWGLPSLPIGGTHNLRGNSGVLDWIKHLIMPAFALGLVSLAGWTRYIRSSMLEVIRQDFVRTAEAKGLRNKSVLFGHAFRNALLPLVTLIGLTLPDLFGGAVVIEQIFAWNGMGRLTVDAANQSDYTLLMGIFVMFAVLILVSNLLADIMYAVLDPRIRYE